MILSKVPLLLATALLSTFVLGACSPKERAKTPKKERVKVVLATNSEPDTLDPLFAEMAASTAIRLAGQRELTVHDPNWEVIPDLAERIPTLENGDVKTINEGNVQRMEVTWHIRKDAKWEDGAPVTADDFIFGWQVTLDETQEIIDRESAARVLTMEAKGPDKKDLVITYKEPFAFFDDFKQHSPYPAHRLLARYKRPDGTTLNMKKDKYGTRPFSNGPFKFKEWLPGQHITFVKNPQHNPPASVDELTFRIIPNNVAMQSALVAGDIDGTLATGGLTVPDIEQLRKEQGDKFEYYSVPGLVWAHIDFNLDAPELKDKRVRKAIAHAVNRKEIIEKLYYGKYTLSHTFLPPRHWGYKKDVKTLDYDLQLAAKLLDEAGWKQEKAGEIRVREGKKLELSISAVAGIKDIEQLQQVMQSDLRKIGVSLLIDNKPAKVFFGDLARHRKFPHLSFYSWVMSPSSWGNTLWQSDMIPSKENSWQGQNYPGWNNKRATELLRQVPSELNRQKRAEMMAEVQDLWVDELPAIPMYFRPVVAVSKKTLKGVAPTGTLTPMTWNIGKWTMDAN